MARDERNFDWAEPAISEYIGTLYPSKANLFTACDSLLLSPKDRQEEDSLNPEISLITDRLKQRIIRTLEARYDKTGINDAVSWRGLWIELGVDEDEFCKALNAAAEEHPQPAIVFTDSDHIKINLKVRSETKVTRGSIISPEAETSEGLTTRLFGLFTGLSKRKTQRVETQLGRIPSST